MLFGLDYGRQSLQLIWRRAFDLSVSCDATDILVDLLMMTRCVM